jgi:hypothetical protein
MRDTPAERLSLDEIISIIGAVAASLAASGALMRLAGHE